jgi:hypothetical protein
MAVVAVVTLAPALLLTPAHAREQAPRILDRTYSCEAGYIGGLYQVQLSSTFQTAPSSSKLQAFASVTKNMWESPYGQLGSTGLSVHRRLCIPARGKVKLTTSRMRGGAVPPLGVDARCETPRRVLMRVRAVFSRPPQVATSRQFGFPQLTAFGPVREAAIALATPAGRPIAYVSVTGTEKARLFTVRTCEED